MQNHEVPNATRPKAKAKAKMNQESCDHFYDTGPRAGKSAMVNRAGHWGKGRFYQLCDYRELRDPRNETIFIPWPQGIRASALLSSHWQQLSTQASTSRRSTSQPSVRSKAQPKVMPTQRARAAMQEHPPAEDWTDVQTTEFLYPMNPYDSDEDMDMLNNMEPFPEHGYNP